MGLLASKPDEEIYYTDITPVKYEAPKRLLHHDPRSPTDNITRTPIVVDQSPEILLDPRSPTPGIVRTPITSVVCSEQATAQCFQLQEDNSEIQVTDHSHTTTLLNVPSEKTEMYMTVQENRALDLSVEVCEQNSGVTETAQAIQDISKITETFSVSETTCDSLSSMIEHQNTFESSISDTGAAAEFQNFSMSDDEGVALLNSNSQDSADKREGMSKKIKNTSKIPRPCRPKKLFTEKRMCDVTRSPLSTVIIDTNSPRNIMHRKQAKKIDKARQNSSDMNKPSNKENFTH